MPRVVRCDTVLVPQNVDRGQAAYRQLSLSETSSGWRVGANRAMLLSDVGLLQTDLVGACRAVPIEAGARGGEPGAAPADQRPAADRAREASPQQHRPIDIRRPLSAVPRCSRRAGDRQAGYRDPLAPGRVQSLLALEIENPRGTAKGAAGDTPVDP